MMEDILTSIQREATSAKLKNLREACVLATDGLYLGKTGRENFHPYELREQCLLPLKLALDSRNNKLSVHAVNGLQKLISDDRFRSNCEEDVESQLPVQFFNAVASTPTLSDEVQVEVMKMLLIITSSASCEIHGEYLIKIAEVCIETYTRAHQLGTKTACRATLIQMLSSVCQRLQDSVGTNTSGSDSKIPRPSNLMSTDSSKVLTQDVVLLLKHLSFRLNSGPSSAAQLNHALPLYLESILTMLSNLPPALQLDREFVNVIWQLLCPALIQLLGSPLNDLGRKPKPPGTPDEGNRGGRGTGGLAKSSPVGLTLARTIYHIAGELLRLVGPLAAMRPVLESLFHRIILYPPPLQRNEALKALKEILANPQRLLDASGPTIIDKDNPPSPNSPTEQKKSELDLLRLWMDGIVESSRCNDPAVSSSSVACVVALLGSLEDLSQGRCLDDQDIDMLSKIKEDENWEEVYDGKIKYENAASARMVPKFTVANEAFDDAFREDIGDNDDEDGHRRMKPKHIRWKMDQYSEDGEESIDSVTERFMNDRDIWSADLEDENSDFPQPKSVRWALNDDVLHLEPYDSRQPKSGIPQKPGVPRRNGASQKRFGFVPQNNSVRPVKRTPSMDKSRERPRVINKMDPDQERRGSDSNLQNQENGGEKPKLIRSISDLDISPEKQPSLEFPLRRCSSLTELSSPAPEQDGDVSKTKITQPSNKTVPQHDCVNNARPVNKKSIPRLVDRPGTNMQRRGDAIDEEELDDRNRPKRGQIHGAASNDRSPTKPLRPILRRTKSTSEYDRKTGGKGEKPKGILVKVQGGLKNPKKPNLSGRWLKSTGSP